MLTLSLTLRDLLNTFRDARTGVQPFTHESSDAFTDDLQKATEEALRLELILCDRAQMLTPEQLADPKIELFPVASRLVTGQHKNER